MLHADDSYISNSPRKTVAYSARVEASRGSIGKCYRTTSHRAFQRAQCFKQCPDQAGPRITCGGLQENAMSFASVSLAKTIFATAVVAVALATPAFAGFQYQGSPKFGEFYVYAAPQVGRAATTARQNPFGANAAMTSEKSPFKGGIGNRAP
jgi:hypothetical protein